MKREHQSRRKHETCRNFQEATSGEVVKILISNDEPQSKILVSIPVWAARPEVVG
jgi:hypothetical protein